MKDALVATSKFLSLVLRHRPDVIGIELDAEGWVSVEDLLAACAKHGRAELTAAIAAASGVPAQQVAAILEALAVEIKRSLGRSGTGAITLPGLMKIERKTVPGCPTWPASVKVSLAPELLPGPDSGCDRGLRTYFRSPATNGLGHPLCGLCGQDTIDWKRLHRRRITDAEHTITQLKTDRWQYKWWASNIDPKAVRHAIRKGRSGIEDAVRRRVFQSVGRVYQLPNGKAQPHNDGGQTTDKVGKMTILHYGQHATATCCRKCLCRPAVCVP